MNKALLVIDLHNHYFPNGLIPFEGTSDKIAKSIIQTIIRAKEKGIPVILIQHAA
ncbi:hypothetical protein [Candidatus Nitrosacidococcus sp. I8]|uniref:hypothetical protein n=1 Tax=Candidatus Nitrosacidococcus sp. I8 TaxID=2942908 RepID=UPI002227C1A4|nr:hypothetical protein [Candidatus Nitrosacidococcus sp. I8]CAH9017621.1 hypothetical protein NURINAE_00461 [Candidatus Nitrosacidococcus sp. I8]